MTAIFDVLDGEVARRTGQIDGFRRVLRFHARPSRRRRGAGGLTVFYATNPDPPQHLHDRGLPARHRSGPSSSSYTRARAEALGIDAKVGVMQRPERIVLLSAPQAFFGLF